MKPALTFLIAARHCEIDELERLARTSALVGAIAELVHALQRERGLTVVVALHDLTWALRYCDHILVLNAGRLEAAGTPGQVLTPALVEKVFGVRAQTVEGSFGALVDVGPL